MNGNQKSKHENQFLSKQTLGPFGWDEKIRGDQTNFNQKKKKKIGWCVKKWEDRKWGDDGKVE